MLTPEQRGQVVGALQRYGAHLADGDFIAKAQKVMSVRVEVSKGRLRMFSGNGVLATYPAKNIGPGVADFVEKFWFWKPA